MSLDPFVLTRFAPSFVEEEPLHRRRLLGRIQSQPNARLIVVQAPAGSGKTTLLYDYVRSSPTPAAWLALQETDRDQRLFATYLVEALARRYQTPFQSRQLISHPSPPNQATTEAILTALVNDLVNTPGSKELILDDLHFVNHEPPILEVISFLVNNAPKGFRLFVTTRETPPPALRLAHLRSKGAALVLGPEDLGFTRDEVAELVQRRWPQGSSEASIDLLVTQTEGWVTGIELLHQSLIGQPPTEVTARLQHLNHGSGLIFEYLAEEILSRQPPTMRLFLLTTSILEAFDSAAARVATGCLDAADLMLKLDSAGLFLVHLDDKRQLFRYHHLFSDFLRATLTRELGDVGVADLHRRLARWYEDQRDIRSAVHHTLKSEDWDHAATLLEQHGEGLMKQGLVAPLEEWLERLGTQRVESNLKLMLLRGQVRELQGDWVSATQDYERMLETARVLGHNHQMPAIMERLALCCANYGQMERMEQYVEEASAHCPPDDLALKSQIYHWFGASLLISGRDWKRGYSMIRESYQLARLSHNPSAIAGACMPYGFIYHFGQGNLAEAEKTLAEGIELYERLGRKYDAYHLMMNRAVVVLFLGTPQRALSLLEQARPVVASFPNSFAHIAYEQTLAKAYLEIGDLGRCRYHLAALRHQEIPFQLKPWYQRTHLLLCLLEDNLEQAHVAGQEIVDLLRIEGPGLYAPECLWALALLHRRRAEITEAEQRLTTALQMATESQAKYWQMKSHAGLAAIELQWIKGKRGHTHLKEAMRLSRENGYDGFWASDMAKDACQLALEALSLHLEPDYSRRILMADTNRFMDALPNLIDQSSPAAQAVACEILGSIDTPRATGLLDQIGRSRHYRVRRAAHQAIHQTSEQATLEIRALGSFQVKRGEKVMRTPNRRRVIHLLKYLVCYHDRVCLDDQIIDVLWPTHNLEKGRHTLHNHMNWLRDYVDPSRKSNSDDPYIVRSEQGYTLRRDSDLWIDVRAFEDAARRVQDCRIGDLNAARVAAEKAIGLYSGDLLADDLYEDWTNQRRAELAHTFDTVLEQLADIHLAQGSHQDVIVQCQRLLQRDPYNEKAYRSIIRSYTALGNRAEALRSVESLINTIHSDGAPKHLQDLLAELQVT